MVAKLALDTKVADVLAADAIVIGTTENFGAVAGLVKDFFERVYYPCLEHTQGKPYALYVRAGQDGSGAVRDIERIAAGLRWRAVQPALILVGDYQPRFVDQCEQLGMAMSAGLAAGIY